MKNTHAYVQYIHIRTVYVRANIRSVYISASYKQAITRQIHQSVCFTLALNGVNLHPHTCTELRNSTRSVAPGKHTQNDTHTHTHKYTVGKFNYFSLKGQGTWNCGEKPWRR